MNDARERLEDEDRFRKPAPLIDLTPEVIAELQRLLDGAQKHASINGLPWRRGASRGKPLLYGGEEGRGALIAYGTIGSWNEIDLAVAAVNALPALLADLRTVLDALSDEVTDAMIEAGVEAWRDPGGTADCRQAVREIYTAMRAALLERGRK